MTKFDLTGRKALVTGAARGIGAGIAQALADAGAAVMIGDVLTELGRETAKKLSAGGAKAGFVPLDVTKDDDWASAVSATVKELGGFDLLVNNAGIEITSLVVDVKADDLRKMFDVNAVGTLLGMKHAFRAMRPGGTAAKGGSIVNIASVAGVTGALTNSVEGSGYGCAKHGVVGLTRTIALTYAKKNIRANAICPGYIRTAQTRALYETADEGQSHVSEVLRVPLDRWGEPDEIGRVAAFLASDDASYITGQPIIVDGGIMAR